MALANIFAKLNELETKLQNVSPVSPQGVSSSELESLLSRVAALEQQACTKIQDMANRLNALETKQMPPDVSGKVAILENKLQQVEAKVVDTKPFLEKLTHIETVNIKELKSRVEALEKKMNETETPT
jgi:polyhydroxyalkanoate synthesis regulator phasin